MFSNREGGTGGWSPSYLGGRNQEDQAKRQQDHLNAQGTEFKPQHCQKIKIIINKKVIVVTLVLYLI
jgi:hypothetical protein